MNFSKLLTLYLAGILACSLVAPVSGQADVEPTTPASPEPNSVLMLGCGALGLALIGRRRMKP